MQAGFKLLYVDGNTLCLSFQLEELSEVVKLAFCFTSKENDTSFPLSFVACERQGSVQLARKVETFLDYGVNS